MEFIDGGSLYKLVKEHGPLTEYDTAEKMKEVLKGLLYLHKKGIVHRDLKANKYVNVVPF